MQNLRAPAPRRRRAPSTVRRALSDEFQSSSLSVPNGDSSSQTTTEGAPAVSAAIGDADLAAKVDAAIVDDLVDEVDEVLEAESKPEVDDLVDADGPGINADAAPKRRPGRRATA